MKTIPIAVLGATGYAGEGAVRILLNHPGLHLAVATSDRLAGKRLAEAVPSLEGETDLVLTGEDPEAIIAAGVKGIILAKKAPEVTKVVPRLLDAGIKVVDIGTEFRLRTLESYQKYHGGNHECPGLLPEAVYGLSELHTQAIQKARVVGNPGCYATSILMPLIPLFRERLLVAGAPVIAIAYSGLSGAGKRFIESNNNLFYAVNENLHAYKACAHQHVGEVDQELSAALGSPVHCSFVPHLAPITRGILASLSVTLAPGKTLKDVQEAWAKTFAGRPFVRVRNSTTAVEVTNVAGTNFQDIAAVADGQTLIIQSTLDNLVKGASGQAVQNLNLMLGLPETMGLLGRGI
jgi:N-acetyl-gamma-glutamyl-phosphate reductase